MPRKTALDALQRFRRDGAWSRQVMAALIRQNRLDARDGGLASRMFYGILQNMTYLDHVIDAYARGKLEPKVRDILRLGAYQILFMDRIPDRAAVNESVSLCRELGYARVSGLVNAVLRRVIDHKYDLPLIPGEGTAAYLSIRYSHPQWLAEELVAERGYDGAEAVLRANNTEPPIYLQVNTLRTTAAACGDALGAKAHDSIPDCLALDGGDFMNSDAFRDGWFYVQDPAARLAVMAADPGPGERVLDICSAPGGKSFAAAIAMKNEGKILSRDISGGKLNLVMDGADRMGLTAIECREGDARDIDGAELFDLVLADVPCSGLGVIRKKPDIRWRDAAGLASLPELQAEILESACRAVRPGGRLLYSTCTWRRSENEGVTEAFLAAHHEFTKTQEKTFWPDTDGTDGFYLCRMDRKNEI